MKQLAEDVLVIKNLKKYFPTEKKDLYVKAVDDISFTVRKGEVVGLVGESGSGKSTTAYMVMGMYGPTALRQVKSNLKAGTSRSLPTRGPCPLKKIFRSFSRIPALRSIPNVP